MPTGRGGTAFRRTLYAQRIAFEGAGEVGDPVELWWVGWLAGSIRQH